MEFGGTPFFFPESEVPPHEETKVSFLGGSAGGVPMKKFEKLTKLPILLIYGDYIPDKPSEAADLDKWHSEMAMSKKFVSAVNKPGGRAQLIHLPDLGIFGNSHFLMAKKQY